MRTTALLLLTVFSLGSTAARAEEPAGVHQRGFLTHLGMGFLIAGLFSTGAGVAGVIGANDANTRLQAYSGASIAAEQPSVEALQARLGANTVLAAVGVVLGPIATAFGIGFIAGDAPRASVAFVPLAQGGVFVLSAGF